MTMTMTAIQKHLGNFSRVRINANEGVLGRGLGPGQRNETKASHPPSHGKLDNHTDSDSIVMPAAAVRKVGKGKSAYTATPGIVAADQYAPGLYAASR